jgi:hypothetical protein
MRVLLDEQLPRHLAREITARYQNRSAMRLAGLKNRGVTLNWGIRVQSAVLFQFMSTRRVHSIQTLRNPVECAGFRSIRTLAE